MPIFSGMKSPDLGHTPRSLRARLGLTQTELAHKARVSERTIRNWEDGKDVSLDNLRSLAEALEVTIEAAIAAIDTERERARKAAS